MKSFWNAVKRHKIRTAVVLLLVVAVIVRVSTLGGGDTGMIEEEAELRDIYTYNSFVGNVKTESERSVLSRATAEAVEVCVSEGDTVREGEVIAKLDSSDLEYNISLQESSLAMAQTTGDYNVQDARRAYDDYKEALDSGLNTAVLTAKAQMDSARESWESARTAYSTAEKAIDNGTYDGTLTYYTAYTEAEAARDNAKTSYEDAAEAVTEAKAARDEAKETYEGAKEEEERAKSALSEAEQALSERNGEEDVSLTAELEGAVSAAQAALDAASSQKEMTSEAYTAAQTAYETAKAQRDSLKSAYETAKTACSDAQTRLNEKKQSTLQSLQDNINAAKTAYDGAVSSYNAAVLSANQQLNAYADAVDKTEASSDTTTNEMELDNLRDSLKDYTITAPCDGTVTALNISEGDMVTGGMTAAVISNLNTMEVDIRVDEYSVLNASAGSDVTIYLDSIDASYDGTITWIADTATIENGVSYYEATVSFTADEKVRSGMSVEVRLTNADERDVVTVSLDALNYNEDNTVYVLLETENGKQEERTVEVGASDGTYVQITEGLAEGDIVLLEEGSSNFLSNLPIGALLGGD